MIDNRPDKSGFAGHAVLFPIVEEYRDCAGVRRVFKIESEQTDLGWMLTATEQNDRPHGYSFKEFSTASPAEALGPLRHKIKAGLAIRYLDSSSKKLALTHDLLRGSIAIDPETERVGVLVDGTFVSMKELEELLNSYEGWEFEMSLFG
jgi:hypothetical protein